MSLKMKKILAVSAVALIVVIIAVIIVIANNKPEDNVKERIDLAKQYCEQMDYDKSVALYNQLLQTDADEPDIYMGLYDVYMIMGRQEKALEILQRGAENTNNKAIREKLGQITGETVADESESTEASEISDTEVVVTEMSVESSAITSLLPESQSSEAIASEETTTDATTTTPETTTTAHTTTTPQVTTTVRTTTTPRVTTTIRTTTTPVVTTTTPKITTTAATTKAAPVGEYTIKQRWITDYVLSKADVREQGIPSNAIINVVANNAIVSFNSSVFDNVDSIDLSATMTHTTTKSVVKFKSSKFPCPVNVTLTSSSMSDKTLKLAHLFHDGKDNGAVKLSGDGYPMFTANGGTYTIERVEEVTQTTVKENPGYAVIGVSNLSSYVLNKTDVKDLGNNQLVMIRSNNVEIYLNTSVFEKTDSVNLGMIISNNTTSSTVKFNDDSSLGCEIKVVLTTCDMSSRSLAKAHLYRNGVDLGSVKLDANKNPYFTASTGGKYVIQVPEE